MATQTKAQLEAALSLANARAEQAEADRTALAATTEALTQAAAQVPIAAPVAAPVAPVVPVYRGSIPALDNLKRGTKKADKGDKTRELPSHHVHACLDADGSIARAMGIDPAHLLTGGTHVACYMTLEQAELWSKPTEWKNGKGCMLTRSFGGHAAPITGTPFIFSTSLMYPYPDTK